jgi:hypothetical protein
MPLGPATPAGLHHGLSSLRPGSRPTPVLTPGDGSHSSPLLKHAAAVPLPLFSDGRGEPASSPRHVTTESGLNFGHVDIDTNDVSDSSDSTASKSGSDAVDDYRDVDTRSPLSPHLSQLLNLGGRSVYSLQGGEAAEAGTKLHSVRFWLINRENADLTRNHICSI